MTLPAVRPLPAALALVAALAAAWSLLSPLGSVPDEPAHVIYAAAVVRGQLGDATGRVTVPTAVAAAAATTCPAFRPEVTADCVQPVSGGAAPVRSRTSAGRYPPLFYALVGWPTLFGFGDAVWYLMRLLSVASGTVLLVVASRAWRAPPPALAGALVLAATPMATFLLGSVNPNGLEVVAGVAVALAGTGCLERLRAGLPADAWPLALCGSVLALARPGSYVLLSGLLLVLFVLDARTWWGAARSRDRSLFAPLALLVAAVTVAAAYGAAVRGDGVASGATRLGLRGAAALTLGTWDDYLWETVGVFGWRDHRVPILISFLWLGAVTAVAVSAWLVARPVERLAVLALAVGGLLVTPCYLFYAVFTDGTGYQGRYVMALTQAVPVLAGAVLLRHRVPDPRLLPRAAVWLALTLQLLALGGSYLRYAVGLPLERRPLSVLRSVVWVPGSWPLVLLALLVAAASAAVLVRTPADSRTRESRVLG